MNGKVKKARLQFLTWLRKTNPALYNTVIDRADAAVSAGQLNGLGETEQPSFWSKITQGLAAAGTTYLTLKNQKDAMEINLARAQSGLPPIDAGTSAPVIRTQIDLPPDVISKITNEAGLNINKILLFAGIGLAAFLLMK